MWIDPRKGLKYFNNGKWNNITEGGGGREGGDDVSPSIDTSMIAETYDSNKTYNIGDLAIKDGKL